MADVGGHRLRLLGGSPWRVTLVSLLLVAAMATTVLVSSSARSDAVAFAVDQVVSADSGGGASTIAAPGVSTAVDNVLVVAFVSSDGPAGGKASPLLVRGGGLTWTEVARADGQRGIAQVWTAMVPTPRSNLVVTAQFADGPYDGSISVATFTGAAAISNVATASQPGGPPAVSVPVRDQRGLVWAVGDDWDQAAGRVAMPGQTIIHQFLAPVNDTYWVQRLDAPAGAATAVVLGDTAPSSDRFNLVAVEIDPSPAASTGTTSSSSSSSSSSLMPTTTSSVPPSTVTTSASSSTSATSTPAPGVTSPTSSPATTVPVTSPPGGRDKYRWPFASSSIWNLPIGSGAVFVPTSFAPPAQGWGVDENPIVMSPGAPLRAVYTNGIWPASCATATDSGLQLPVPDNFIVPAASGNDQPNFAGGIVKADGSTIVDGQSITRCNVAGPLTMFGLRSSYSIYGDGRPGFGGHGGSGMSAVGGSIRLGELTGSDPIRHALKITLNCAIFCHLVDATSPGFRWPAVATDSGGGYGSLAGSQAPPAGLGMGSLLAIPPTQDINSLGLETAPGKKLAWTLQNYGMYVVDNSVDPGTWDAEMLDVQLGVPTEMRAAGIAMDTWTPNGPAGAWDRDMNRLFTRLQLVDNNGPGTVGGGGIPRQPLAPPISN